DFFVGDNAKADAYFKWLLAFIPDAFPIIEFVASLTPTTLDDAALAFIRAQYPRLFHLDLTEEERKLYLLAVSAELLKQKYSLLTTTAARIIVQVVYGLRKLGSG
ncbi:MAG: hypothetical protein ABIG68_02035, partial [Acidobacteriota bacterium]